MIFSGGDKSPEVFHIHLHQIPGLHENNRRGKCICGCISSQVVLVTYLLSLIPGSQIRHWDSKSCRRQLCESSCPKLSQLRVLMTWCRGLPRSQTARVQSSAKCCHLGGRLQPSHKIQISVLPHRDVTRTK